MKLKFATEIESEKDMTTVEPSGTNSVINARNAPKKSRVSPNQNAGLTGTAFTVPVSKKSYRFLPMILYWTIMAAMMISTR